MMTRHYLRVQSIRGVARSGALQRAVRRATMEYSPSPPWRIPAVTVAEPPEVHMKKLVLAITLAAVAVLTVQIQSVAACGITKSAAYSQHSRHAHRTAAVHVATLQR
jgi:hypothetical protein